VVGDKDKYMHKIHLNFPRSKYSWKIPSSKVRLACLSYGLLHLRTFQEFLKKYSESKYEYSDSTVNFGRHKVLECAREILEKSQDTTLDKDTFIRISDDLELMLAEVGAPDKWVWLVRLGVWCGWIAESAFCYAVFVCFFVC